MDTPILTQGMYVLMLAASAAVVTYAALVTLRHLFPSLAIFYGTGAHAFGDAPPYGAVMAVVALGFSFAAYVTPATIMAGFAMLVLVGVASAKPLPPMTIQLSAFIAAGLAFMADASLLKADGFTPFEMGLGAGFVAAPVLASFAPMRSAANTAALSVLVLVLLGAVVAAPVLTQSFAHGTASASVLLAAAAVMLLYMRRYQGVVGPGTLVAVVLLAAHSALILAHGGMMLLGLAMMGAVVFASFIAAGGRAVQ